jgi:hypothetical protein
LSLPERLVPREAAAAVGADFPTAAGFPTAVSGLGPSGCVAFGRHDRIVTEDTGRDIEARLAAAAEAMCARETFTAQLAVVNSRLAGVDERIGRHTARLADEERDVRRLEGLSLARVLAAIRRTYAEDLDRERAERDAELYKLSEAQAQRDLLQQEADRLAQRIVRLRGAREAWTAVLAEKETHLSRYGGPQAGALLALAEERGQLRSEQREVGEALAAAADADHAIVELLEHLTSAEGWSTYDTFVGGGALSSAVKHGQIDAAQRAASYAETRLVVLSKELRDVGGGGPVAPSLGGRSS